MVTLAFLIVVGATGWMIFRPSPRRDAAAAQAWASFHQYATHHGWSLLYVQNVYQHARRGSKAIVSIYGDAAGASRDAWFWGEQVQAGSVVAVSLNQGWGPHTNRDDVLYIGNGTPGVYATFGARELVKVQRHFHRQSTVGGTA
ncbi:hypothetical protein H7I87_18765 [Mycobacterium timonense]|uniref:DUF4350 domain-containing protein n=2 Tax=Mycobacterium avium complex (MAC) TaxID=120793 RepID=A0AAW5S6L2_MYCBC|nr:MULTISPECIES: hypothetical protein [Mycobacterium avium complex (MAC)]MCV6990797.1 hypothetical protein [Mycobacterium bouchedurhonense]MCV6996719.1 hypothetical protein [Mycobacterium timonense]ORA41841.1 hypothetical protein BST19_27480 [Mycobacterium bouchedurhonense]ORB76764.1 hypothetical protein BST46_28265 [Mycobacterium timonense]